MRAFFPLLSVFFLWAGCSGGGFGRWVLPEAPVSGRVLAVLDGDTIEVECFHPVRGLSSSNITIRLLYIDTLETSDNPRMERTLSRSRKTLGFMTREEYLDWGDRAKKNLAQMIPVGSSVEIDTPAESLTDGYGRVLGLVWAGNTNLNLAQVEAGLAFTYFLESVTFSWTRYYHRQFELAERSAKSRGAGFWRLLKEK